MDKQLLSTKLFIPALRPGYLERPRLTELLHSGVDGGLTLVSAAAGFGKSSLVSEWVRQIRRPTTWITLDKNDNDLNRFLAYLTASLQAVNLDVHDLLLSEQPGLPGPDLKDRLVPLINRIIDHPHPFNLVLDDYHLIHNQDIHDALSFLLVNQPPPLHLVIISRSDPPLPLAALRAQGKLTEIRASQLSFTVDDGNKLLNQNQALALPEASIQSLIERTDGWIAAIQMVAIAGQDKADLPGYIDEVSGNQDYIADFLTSEVIQQQQDDLREFLLVTSLLDRFSGPLCDAVAGRADSQMLLKELREKNLFILPLDDRNQWFRYHHLFADLLRKRLYQEKASLIPSLHLKASQWFESRGRVTEAIDHALQGQHMERAAAILEDNAAAILTRSEIATFISWAETLPEKTILNHASLCIYYAWALLASSGDHSTADRLISALDDQKTDLQGQVSVVKSMLALTQKKIPDAIHLSQQALAQIPPEDDFFRQVATWNLSALLFISGDTEGGSRMLKEVARISLANRNLLVAVIALTRLGSHAMLTGELDLAEEYFEQASQIRPDHQDQPLPASCEAILGLGKLAWERYDLEAAQRYLEQGLILKRKWRSMDDISDHLTMAHLLQSLGNEERAKNSLALARENAARTTLKTDDDYVASQAAHLAIRQGDLSAARKWAAERELEEAAKEEFILHPRSGAEIVRYFELITYARFLLAADRADQALMLLKKLTAPLRNLGYRGKELEVRILQILALSMLGSIDPALQQLEELLSDASWTGYKRTFIDEGQPLADLIQAVLDRGLDSPAGQELVLLMAGQSPAANRKPAPPGLIETLSEREFEILRLLRSELSVPELAGQLFITPSTLRTHIKNIYRKLGVHSRFEAVSRARELELI